MSMQFKFIENKYNPLLSRKKPLIVKASIKVPKDELKLNISSIKDIDFISRKIAKDLSYEYNCVAFSSFNEISILIEDFTKIEEIVGKLESHSVVSLFSQEISNMYNQLSLNNQKTFVKVNTFNIHEEKIKNYFYDRQACAFNNYILLLSSKVFSITMVQNKKQDELLRIMEDMSPNLKSLRKYIKDGFTVKKGFEIEISDMEKDVNASICTKELDADINNPIFGECIDEDL